MTQRAPIYTRIGPRERVNALLTWTNGVQLGIQPRPFIPRQWDWPNPVRAIVNADLRTWINELPQSALSLTIPAGQRQRDWPNPTLRRSGELSWLVQPQLAAPVLVSLPFNQQDWPNPVVRAQGLDSRTWVEGLPQTALSLTIPPRQADWPNPAPAEPNFDLRSWTYAQQIAPAVVVQAPFNQFDWPNPQPTPPNLTLRTWAQPDLAISLSLVSVPNVVTETQAQASIDIVAAGLTVVVTSAYSATVAAGIVISQAPTAGSLALPGDAVTIVVSLGVQPVSTVVAAGIAGKRHRYFIEIDGQQFLVDNAPQAHALLQQARALAERRTEIKAERVIKRLRKKAAVPQVVLETPVITASPELDVSADIRAIEAIYTRAAQAIELRLLLEKKAAEEDDDDDVLLLI